MEGEQHPREEELEHLRASGLYDPDSPSAAQRLELLRYLLERFTVDEIEHWARLTSI